MPLIASPLSFRRAGASLHDAIVARGKTAGLIACYDIGAASSWPGTGQHWLDMSGNGNDVFLGPDVTVTTNDPTPAGTPGALSPLERWQFGGDDFFRHDGANPAEVETLHKNNAIWSWFAAVNHDFGAGGNRIFATHANNPANVGVMVAITTGGGQNVTIADGGGTFDVSFNGTAALSGGWHFYAGSIYEAGGMVSFLWVDGDYSQVGGSDLFDAAYPSPSAAAATYALSIGSGGNAELPLKSGSEMSMLALFDGTHTKADFDFYRAMLQGRLP